MHNTYSLRGAKIRDSLAWSKSLDDGVVGALPLPSKPVAEPHNRRHFLGHAVHGRSAQPERHEGGKPVEDRAGAATGIIDVHALQFV